ncbi:caspase-2-like [Gigantopelta aegis]|uniref:caspase-2-like n=1 Tax=Gigantopelta aegis TaxID=1735272 RepID=UPI001B88CB9B|nr:caspase-2-like [Gigantopelta aegis]
MDPQHKNILITQRANLVENLNIRDGLYTQLITRGVLNTRMVRTIQHNHSPDQQAEELLTIIPTRGPDAFSKFCDALIADDQQHVVDLYLKIQSKTSGDKKKSEQCSDKDGDGTGVKKRPRSPSPTIICFKDGTSNEVVLKYLSQGLPAKKSHSFSSCESSFSEFPGEVRLNMKHYVSSPVSGFVDPFIPVALKKHSESPSTTHVGFLPQAYTERVSFTRCDTIDTMHKNTNVPMSSHSTVSPSIEPDPVLFDETEDLNIDLTDGPVCVQVAMSSRQFYLTNHKKSYPMKKLPRGKALIVNVNEVLGKPPRHGTDIDRDNLCNLLKQLHFDTIVYNDSDGLTAEDLRSKLKKFSGLPEHQESDGCVICLLSHGDEGFIFGTDGKKIPMDEIFEMYDNSRCRGLLGKPKVFIIQACRGGAFDKGVSFMQDAGEIDGRPPVRPETSRQIPTMSDTVICYPTQHGYYAWRNCERGSWYIEAIVQVFMRHAKNEDICTMLNRVNRVVSSKVSRCPQIEMDRMCQMSEYKSTLTKPHLFFFPGIGCP